MKAKCRNAIGGMVLAMLTANMAGCQLFPYLVAQFAPPKKVKALYKPQSKSNAKGQVQEWNPVLSPVNPLTSNGKDKREMDENERKHPDQTLPEHSCQLPSPFAQHQ